jgi:hypothetical protein
MTTFLIERYSTYRGDSSRIITSTKSFLAALLFLITAQAPIPVAKAQDLHLDIRSYDLLVKPDFSRGTLQLSAQIVVDNPSHDSTIFLRLADWYTDIEVNANSSRATLERHGVQILVRWHSPQPVDTLTFNLAGKPGASSDEDRPIIMPNSLFLLWSDNFYPWSFDEWAIVKTTLILPSNFQAIAPGRLLTSKTDSTRITYIFETTYPTRQISIFADSHWTVSEHTMNGLTFRTLLHPQSQKWSDRILETSADVVAYFTGLFGCYPFDGFSFITIDSMYARRSFAGFVGYSPPYLEKEMIRTGHDAHETSLLWWGYTLGGQGPGSFQWTEGFGDYAEILYDESRKLPQPAIFGRFRNEYLATPAKEEPTYAQLRGNTPQKIVHGKYPWLLHAARFVVGDSAFHAGLRLLFRRYTFRTFTIDEFVSTVEEGVGQSLKWWRDEWLERKGVLELTFEYSVELLGGKYRIAGSMTQTGNLYHIPIELAIENEKETVVERVIVSQTVTRFAFESTTKPRRIILDPNRWLLAKIKETKI